MRSLVTELGNAGFLLQIDIDGGLLVYPGDSITAAQEEFIRLNKKNIVLEIKALELIFKGEGHV